MTGILVICDKRSPPLIAAPEWGADSFALSVVGQQAKVLNWDDHVADVDYSTLAVNKFNHAKYPQLDMFY